MSAPGCSASAGSLFSMRGRITFATTRSAAGKRWRPPTPLRLGSMNCSVSFQPALW